MTQEPIITIDKFSGMGQGALFCEGFYPDIIAGQSVLNEGFRAYQRFNASTSNFTGLGYIYGGISLTTIYNVNNRYNLYIDGDQKIFSYQQLGTEIKNGLIHTSNTIEYCRYPDIIETNNGNILIPTEKYIVRGLRGAVTSGSTTTIVDTTKNFIDEGITINDKVTNLKTGIEYTITSITTTTNTNDTLNFTASGANTNTANDEYIVWDENKHTTDLTRKTWQPRQTDWVKQFTLYGDEYLFTNGNYIGKISTDESTVDKTFQQLPNKYQAKCINANSGYFIVGGNANNKGFIAIGDSSTSQWLNIIKLDREITAIANYKSDFIFVSNGVVYYTNGYQIEPLSMISLAEKLGNTNINPASHNGLVVYNDLLFLAQPSTDHNLIMAGVYILNLLNTEDGWTFLKTPNTNRPNAIPYSIMVLGRFSSIKDVEVGCDGSLSYLADGASGDEYYDKSIILSINLPRNIQVKGVGLNLGAHLKDYQNQISRLSREITVSVGDGNRPLISYLQNKDAGTSSSFTVNGTIFFNHEVGDELYIIEDDDDLYGERSFITDIQNQGTDTETWTVSPAFSASIPASTDFRTIRVKKFETKTINVDNLKEEIMFYGDGILTNKIFLEIVFKGITNDLPLNINNINIYG